MGGFIEIIDGTHNLFPKNFSGSDNAYVFKGSNPAVLPVINLLSQGGGSIEYFWENYQNLFVLENLMIYHTWNATAMYGPFGSLIYVGWLVNITINRVTFITLNTLLLSRCPIFYSSSTVNYITLNNCIFQDISLMRCSLIYDSYSGTTTLINCTIKNIASL